MQLNADTALTADQAFERYEAALAAGALTQGSWHTKAADGRQLACALGVLGSGVNSPADCSAQIMPRWLAQMVPHFFDRQPLADATAWGLAFYAELKRLNGQVPFSVVHDWHATAVSSLATDWRTKEGVSLDATNALRALHERAQRGDVVSRSEWYEALRAALRESCLGRWANADAYAYADAYADANAYADADAYADAYAYANAYADADAYAYANANADAYAYADADAYAYANADANANANAYADANAWKRLADGMVECLRRVPSVEA